MKKIIALLLTACLLALTLGVTVLAEDVPAVLRVSAEKKDGTTVVIKDYTVFEDGWNAAMELASNSKEMNKNGYARVIVDLYTDWNAVDGQFTAEFFNGKGFNWDAIYFQPNVRMTLNLNGHTINRGLTEWEYNGEVMYIDKRADVIINDGTISGGFSCNGAGGIHVNGASVTLNKVNVIGNAVEDDRGAGIALYGGATLTMNGGSLSENSGYVDMEYAAGGGLYVDNSEAVLTDVFISDNLLKYSGLLKSAACDGAACYVSGGTLTLNRCTIKNNRSDRYGAVCVHNGEATLDECSVTENYAGLDGSAITVKSGTCLVDNSTLVGNVNTKNDSVFEVQFGTLQFSNSEHDPEIKCSKEGKVMFADVSETPVTVGSLFGGGSLTLIISFAALVASVASISVNLTAKRKTSSTEDDATDEE